MVLACASMLFSTNSAMALSGLACESAMIRMAFQSSPILNLPLSDSLDLAALVFATMARISSGLSRRQEQLFSARPQSVTISRSLALGKGGPERMGYSSFLGYAVRRKW